MPPDTTELPGEADIIWAIRVAAAFFVAIFVIGTILRRRPGSRKSPRPAA